MSRNLRNWSKKVFWERDKQKRVREILLMSSLCMEGLGFNGLAILPFSVSWKLQLETLSFAWILYSLIIQVTKEMLWPSPLSKPCIKREKNRDLDLLPWSFRQKFVGILHGLQGALTPNKVVLHCCRLDQGRRRRRSNWQKPEFGSPVQCSRHALKMTLQSLTG